MALFSNLRKSVEDVVGGVSGKGKGSEFSEDLNWTEFSLSSDPSVVTADYKKIGELECPFQQVLKWGYGTEDNPENQGYAMLDAMVDSSTNADGNVRFMVVNANDISKGIVFTRRTETLRKTRSEYADGIPMAEQTDVVANPQDKLIVKMKGDSAQTVSNTDTSAVLPITRFVAGA